MNWSLSFLIFVWSSHYAVAADCRINADVLSSIAHFLSYQDVWGGFQAEPEESLKVSRAGGTYYFYPVRPRDGYSSGLRPVFIYRADGSITATSCSARDWQRCRSELGIPSVNFSLCDLHVSVPPWRRSPDGRQKVRFAARLLAALREWTEIEEVDHVYVRDFNVRDPEILIAIVEPDGTIVFQGCAVRPRLRNLCSWHLFGQTPPAALREMVQSRPYRLYPPPPGILEVVPPLLRDERR